MKSIIIKTFSSFFKFPQFCILKSVLFLYAIYFFEDIKLIIISFYLILLKLLSYFHNSVWNLFMFC